MILQDISEECILYCVARYGRVSAGKIPVRHFFLGDYRLLLERARWTVEIY